MRGGWGVAVEELVTVSSALTRRVGDPTLAVATRTAPATIPISPPHL